MAGRYRVRFQVCKDLGGRRVGVLAEREVVLDVRSCGERRRQRDEPLRLAVTQRGQGSFAFQALFQGPGARHGVCVGLRRWHQLDDDRAPVEHTYPLQALAPRRPGASPCGSRPASTGVGPWRPPPSSSHEGSLPPRCHLPSSCASPAGAPTPTAAAGAATWWCVPRKETAVTWERLERSPCTGMGRRTSPRALARGLQVEERLEHGGFRGYVTVSATEARSGYQTDPRLPVWP